jgi:hypothetical protein
VSDSFDTIPSHDRKRSYNGGYMAFGTNTENGVIEWLKKLPWVDGVDDVRAVNALQGADVDCSIRLRDGRVVLAEIKGDQHLGRSPNFLFETLRINHTAFADKAVTLGWSARSPATSLLYYAPSTCSICHLTMNDFRRAMQNYTKVARGNTKLSYVETDAIKSTVNILIPSEYVEAMPSFKWFPLDKLIPMEPFLE